MDDHSNQEELQRLIDGANPGVPAKPTKLKDQSDPSTHVSIGDAITGKCLSFLQTLHPWILIFE